MDSLTAVSDRQRSADTTILELQKETAELKQRLLQLETSEDSQQQAKRLVCLVFSGPALQAQTRREDAASLIQSVVKRYLDHSLDSAQVRTMIRLKNGKMLVEFTTADMGSDRDILFRSKSKLKGSGLYIAESLTPRRQEMFSQLLKLRKEGKISSVFTRQGNIFVCRSRDSAPTRIGGPEAVRRLAGADAACGLARGRAQAEAMGGRRGSVPAGGAPGSARVAERVNTSPNFGSGMEVEQFSPAGSPGRSRRRSGQRGRRGEAAAAADPSGAAGQPENRQPESSLLTCARDAVQLVHLSPPLQSTPPARAADNRSMDDDELAVAGGDSPVPTVAGDGSLPVGDRPAVIPSPLAGDLEPPLPREAESRREESTVSVRSPALPPDGHRGSPTGSPPTKGGASSRGVRPGLSMGGSGIGEGVGQGEGEAVGIDRGMGVGSALSGVPKAIHGGSKRGEGTGRSRDIREYF
ncbi:hypothetical protein FJT64_013789 [Amphibalanus amphitrite]|uniref:Uncharacterized protein n=1 Tax=Amphibalanus amphitrite TaxID=1232801 RepID=A0A6A4UZ49_AMPAM|nr:hypothetical protein FJT64_013789 [Amphibalanus amphitrite]